MASFSLLVLLLLVSLAAGEQFPVTVQEGDVVVREKVSLLGPGLQKIEVPRHHDLEHVEIFMDFTNDVMVMKYVDLKKCQVSSLPHSSREIRDQQAGLEYARKHVYNVRQTLEKNFGRLEHPQVVTDLRFLRQEIQNACADVPTHMTDLIDFTGRNLDESFLIPASQELYNRMTHRRRRTVDVFQCPIVMFNQKCKVRRAEGACYYFVLCPGVHADAQCVEHLRSGSIKCVPCCTHPQSPRDAGALFKHCDILNW